jgi:four helix bundle protein
MRTYRDLKVYRLAYETALEIHRWSLKLPKIEQYALGDQIRRSSKSVVANLAEGLGKDRGPVEESRFLRIALGSSDETQVWLDFARDLGYMPGDRHEKLQGSYAEISQMLYGLLRKRKPAGGNSGIS